MSIAAAVYDAALTSWEFRPLVLLGLALSAWIYWRGWTALHRQAPRRFPRSRAGSFLLGLAVIYVAVASPVDAFAGLLLQAHMAQHLLLTMVAPPLILAGAPFLPMLRGLPKSWSRETIGPLLRWESARKLGSFLTHPVTALALFALSTFIWHIPYFYDLALRSQAWHEFEHACFFGTALLFWWPVMQPWPSRPHWPRWTMILYLLAADLLNTVLAGFLTFYDQVLYVTYAEAPRVFGISAIDDQAAAGAIMWVGGAMAYLVPAGVIAFKMLAGTKGVRPSEWRARQSGKSSSPTIPSPPPSGERFDFFRVPLLGPMARSWKVRRTLQFVMFTLAAVIVIDGFLGPELSPMNLAGVLPWTHWRAATVVALLVAGNLFCMICPFTFFRDLGRTFLPARWHWPRPLRSKWPAIVLLLLFLWVYEVFSLWDRPWLTAWMLVTYFLAAFLVDGFFRRGSFCKYVCPIGQFHFVQSLMSPLEVRVRETEVCRTCKTHDCLRGNDTQRGCELYLFQPRKVGNMDCTFCMDCVQACPHDNIGVMTTPPLSDLTERRRRSSVGDFGRRLDLAVLILLLTFGAFANAAGMVAPVLAWGDTVQERFGLQTAWVPATLLIVLLLVLAPVLTCGASAMVSRAWSGMRLSLKRWICEMAPGFAPLGFSMWLAHFLFHFFTASHTPIPVAQRMAADLTGGDTAEINWQVQSWAFTSLPGLELFLLDIGLLASLFVLWKRSLNLHAKPRTAFRIFLPWALLVLALFLFGVWIIFQPMEMRGTMMH